jgi:hypothetical protein
MLLVSVSTGLALLLAMCLLAVVRCTETVPWTLCNRDSGLVRCAEGCSSQAELDAQWWFNTAATHSNTEAASSWLWTVACAVTVRE